MGSLPFSWVLENKNPDPESRVTHVEYEYKPDIVRHINRKVSRKTLSAALTLVAASVS
jgi:hypothetical protein